MCGSLRIPSRRASILSNYSVIRMMHLKDAESPNDTARGGSVKEMETKLIIDALKSVRGNRTKAASIPRFTVRTCGTRSRSTRTWG